MNKRQTKAIFERAQQAIYDQQRQKFVETQEDIKYWHPAYTHEDAMGREYKAVRVLLVAAFGNLTGQRKTYGLTGKFFVSVKDADDTSRITEPMEKAEAEKIYEKMVDNITVTELKAMGFKNG